MAVKPDHWIIKMAQEQKMIEPFVETQIRTGISFGVSCYGYDFRLSNEFKVLNLPTATAIDPKSVKEDLFVDIQADSILLPANSYLLARSQEYFRIPRGIITICSGKSTYARCGIVVNVTPFEPEWEGYATISLANTAPVPVRLYAGEGIAQLLFLETSDICNTSYKDKKGKYQSQEGITLSKLE